MSSHGTAMPRPGDQDNTHNPLPREATQRDCLPSAQAGARPKRKRRFDSGGNESAPKSNSATTAQPPAGAGAAAPDALQKALAMARELAKKAAVQPAQPAPVAVAQKRKLLWGSDKPAAAGEPDSKSATVWTKSTLDGDEDGARKAKFLKLMGAAKSKASTLTSNKETPEASPQGQSKDVREALERQFEESRMHTFAGRGAGLGMYTLEPQHETKEQ